MKSPTSAKRFKNSTNLLDFGFANYEYKKMANKNDVIKKLNVQKGVVSEVDIITENDCGTLITKGNDLNIEQNIEMPENFQAPIKKGEIVGKLKYTLNGEIVGECNLISDTDVEKINFFNMEQYILDKWFTLLR